MIKKLGLVISCLLLSFLLLEGSVYVQKKNCQKTPTNIEDLIENEQCAFEYKPYKNIVYDFFSKHLTTEINIDNLKAEFAVVDDIELPQEKQFIKQTQEVIKENNLPKIVIVIDDMGIAHKRTLDILTIKAPLTLAFLTYSNNLEKYIKQATDSGFEVMGHIPMEAKTKFDEAPDTLRVTHTNAEIEKQLNASLDKLGKIKVINNHTGSLFTENKEKMTAIMKILKQRKMAFLDSKTSSKSVGKEVAEKHGVKYYSRNVFLDNENDFDYIIGQLKQTEAVAKKYGYAIAIAHPKSQTYKALKHWIKNLDGFEIVKLSDL